MEVPRCGAASDFSSCQRMNFEDEMSFKYERAQIDYGDIAQLQQDLDATWGWDGHAMHIRKMIRKNKGPANPSFFRPHPDDIGIK